MTRISVVFFLLVATFSSPAVAERSPLPVPADSRRAIDNFGHASELVKFVEHQEKLVRLVESRKLLQQHVMHLLHQKAHHRFNRTKIADRRADQDCERLSSQIRDVEIAAARRVVDELVVPSIERRDDMRLERHALLFFAANVLPKFVGDELVQDPARRREYRPLRRRGCDPGSSS